MPRMPPRARREVRPSPDPMPIERSQCDDSTHRPPPPHPRRDPETARPQLLLRALDAASASRMPGLRLHDLPERPERRRPRRRAASCPRRHVIRAPVQHLDGRCSSWTPDGSFRCPEHRRASTSWGSLVAPNTLERIAQRRQPRAHRPTIGGPTTSSFSARPGCERAPTTRQHRHRLRLPCRRRRRRAATKVDRRRSTARRESSPTTIPPRRCSRLQPSGSVHHVPGHHPLAELRPSSEVHRAPDPC